ncbi:methyltransferase [Nocardiopsis dassonvillei]|uniref:methyltransferase n=1 Tax=Nocardiopsis dassonvillei TaxID=2014 RepID=UPI0036F51A1D
MNRTDDTGAARAAMVRMIYAYMGSQIIRTAVELRVPDFLRDKTRDVGEITEATGAHPHAVHRLLRALVTLDLLTEPEPGRFALAPLGDFLTGDGDHSLRMITRLFTGSEFWDSWRHLTHSIETGRAAFDEVHGQSFYEYLGASPEYAELFSAAMAENARFEAPRIATAHDFGRYRTIVDVGGGDGSLLAGILAENPHVRGVVLETPRVAEQARALLDDLGLGWRCEVVEGDFFEGVPPGADAYVLKSVVRNWDEESCARILRNCRSAMGEGGHLLLVEPVLPERTDPRAEMALESALSDLNMLVLTAGGFERSQGDFTAILEASGFRLAEVSDRVEGTDFRVIRAEPV